MKSIDTDLLVTPDGKARLEVQVPSGIEPGRHRAVLVVDEHPMGESDTPAAESKSRQALCFRSYPVGPVSDHVTFRREDIYGDNGRSPFLSF